MGTRSKRKKTRREREDKAKPKKKRGNPMNISARAIYRVGAHGEERNRTETKQKKKISSIPNRI